MVFSLFERTCQILSVQEEKDPYMKPCHYGSFTEKEHSNGMGRRAGTNFCF